MQCGCPECGILMAKIEKGFESTCQCPACGLQCDICLGTASVIPRGQLKDAPIGIESLRSCED